MTAKEMAHWERWHRRGRLKFQLTVALTWLLVYGGMGYLMSLSHAPATALGVSVVFYFVMGQHWEQRTRGYLQQKQRESGLQPSL